MSYAATVKTSTDMWKLNSWYRGVRKSVTPSLRCPDLMWASSSQEKAELLSLTWFPPPAIISGQFAIPADFYNPSSRPFIPISDKEIHNALSGTSNTSAPGLSDLNYQVLEWAFSSCPDKFGVIIRTSVKLRVHHSWWKYSLVVAIPKPNKKDYSLPRSHRPIQLIECFGKLVEKIVTKCLIFDARKYDLMPFNQFGGHSNASCLDAGLSLTHDINEAKRKGLVSSFLAIDIKGFFDHVNHKCMISVLWHKGFPPKICRWVSLVRIQIDDYTFPLAELKISVPQGSPASPILSYLYSSEVIEVLNLSFVQSSLSYPISLRSYIDNVGFLAISDSLGENVIALKSTLQTVQSLFTSIGMKIDPDILLFQNTFLSNVRTLLNQRRPFLFSFLSLLLFIQTRNVPILFTLIMPLTLSHHDLPFFLADFSSITSRVLRRTAVPSFPNIIFSSSILLPFLLALLFSLTALTGTLGQDMG